MFLLYLFVCNCTCECMFCVGDHLVQAVLPFVLPIFGKIDNNNNNNKIQDDLFLTELSTVWFVHCGTFYWVICLQLNSLHDRFFVTELSTR